MMLKEAIRRGLMGVPIGVMIVQIIAIGISLALRTEDFIPVDPELAADMGGELPAVILQTVLAGVYGFMWGTITVIWNIDRWSLLRQTAVFFAVGAAGTVLIAWNARWMEQTASGLLRFLLIFVLIFAAVWIGNYFFIRRKIRKMNKRIEEQDL